MAAPNHPQPWHIKGTSCLSPISTCCLSWWCPCIIYGRIKHRQTHHGNMTNYSTFNSNCGAMTGLGCLGINFVLAMISRGDMRARYNLEGDQLKDCLCAFCCLPCDLIQQDKETQYQEEQKQPFLNQQPQGQSQMEYKPPTEQQQHAPFHQQGQA